MKSLAAPFTKAELIKYDWSGAIVRTLLMFAFKADQIFHQDVNPLWFGEFPPSLLAILHHRCRFLIADMQGFLRHVRPIYTIDRRVYSSALLGNGS